MLNLNEICTGCMRSKGKGKQPPDLCPFCGYFEIKRPDTYLPHRTILKSRYLTGRIVGEGSYGIAYLGLDLKANTRVAVKEYFPVKMAKRKGGRLLDCSEENKAAFRIGLEEFFNEAKLLEITSGKKNLVKFRDFFQENRTAYIISDYLEGQLLSESLKSGPLPVKYTIEVMQQVLDGLAALHNQGIIHRDIKPENIFLERNRRASLLDMGTAGFLGNEGVQALPAIGTPGFAPPEQYLSENQGTWTDVYACGATLYRCITGVIPTDSVMRNENLIIIPPGRLRPEVPERLSEIILRTLSLDISERIKTAEELGRLLKNISNEIYGEAHSA